MRTSSDARTVEVADPGVAGRGPTRLSSPIKELVYILSPSFSGSTLLTFLLATHPEIATIGELKATAMGDIDEYSCSCGQRIRTCAFWRRVRDAAKQRGIGFEVGHFGTHFCDGSSRWRDRLFRAHVRGRLFERARDLMLAIQPSSRAAYERIMARNVAIAEIVAACQGGSVFLDAAKDPVRLRFWLRSSPWPIRVIRLLRDGRGTACSFMKHYNLSVEDASREWQVAEEECERAARYVPRGRRFTLTYEDLCREPDGTLGQVLAFLQLDPNIAERDFRAVDHHIIGNSMRLSASSEIRLDQRWRDTFSAADLRTFERIAGATNRGNGYPASQSETKPERT